jgi:hypothetical protein
MACGLSHPKLNPDVLEGVLWEAWLAAGKRTKRSRSPVTLNWKKIKKCLEFREFDSLTEGFAGLQANIARATLEANGLL